MVRIWIAAVFAAWAGAVIAQTPAPVPAAATKDGAVDCSKAGIYVKQCEESARRKDPCYGKKDADLDACRSALATPTLRARDCSNRTAESKARCEKNNARDRDAAVAACGGKSGADLERCTSEKLSTGPSPQKEARKTAEKPTVTPRPPAATAVSGTKAGTAAPTAPAAATTGYRAKAGATASTAPAAATTGTSTRSDKKSGAAAGTTPAGTSNSTTSSTSSTK